MTLERHRSHLIPDIEYGGDGTLFVTSRDGTFPLRGKEGRTKSDVRDMDFDGDDRHSFRSYDPKRESKRKYKQRASQYGAEVQNMSGTVSTGSSHSLGRRLRRTKTQRYSTSETGRVEDGGGRWDSTSRGRRRGGSPKMPPEFAASIRRQKRAKSLDLNSSLKRRSAGANGVGSLRKSGRGKDAFPVLDYNGNGRAPLVSDFPSRHRRIHDERLPYIVPLVVGPGLIIVGVARLCISFWHEYFCGLWSGALLLIFGIIGARHKGNYLHRGKNGAYITFALLSAVAVMISTGLTLKVLIPILKLLAEEEIPTKVPESDQVAFSNLKRSLITTNLGLDIMTWLSVAMDFSTLLLCLVGFYSLTAAMIGMGNHWDASYETTSDCDHRGNPKFFNPLEQVSLGQSTTFIGILVVVILQVLGSKQELYWSPAWAGILVMLAGFLTIGFGKRADKGSLCVCSSLWQLLALAGIGAATVLLTLGVVNDVKNLVEFIPGGRPNGIQDETEYKHAIATAATQGIFIFIAVVNIIYIVGSLFRNCRQKCCDWQGRDERSDVSITRM